MTSISTILAERQKTHGEFSDHAKITQNLKVAMHNHVGWTDLTNSQRESLDMIAHKIGRILAGNPNHADSWVDIAGYSQLIVNQIEGAGK